MAVYTLVATEEIAAFVERFSVGILLSAKGIAEGVENSNYLIETDQGRFVLTLYEKRVQEKDLPLFLALIDHFAQSGLPVPRALVDSKGESIHDLHGRKACVMRFLTGVSVTMPTVDHVHQIGIALAQMRLASATFSMRRDNDFSLAAWAHWASSCRAQGEAAFPGIQALIDASLHDVTRNWPQRLPHSTIHGDLFPDNALFLNGVVTGLIDFYFACTDIAVYDLAVCMNAWCFDPRGEQADPSLLQALIAGYESLCPLSPQEREHLPLLAQGAALRFLLSRLYDWLYGPAGALVTRKDPLVYANRVQYWRSL